LDARRRGVRAPSARRRSCVRLRCADLQILQLCAVCGFWGTEQGWRALARPTVVANVGARRMVESGTCNHCYLWWFRHQGSPLAPELMTSSFFRAVVVNWNHGCEMVVEVGTTTLNSPLQVWSYCLERRCVKLKCEFIRKTPRGHTAKSCIPSLQVSGFQEVVVRSCGTSSCTLQHRPWAQSTKSWWICRIWDRANDLVICRIRDRGTRSCHLVLSQATSLWFVVVRHEFIQVLWWKDWFKYVLKSCKGFKPRRHGPSVTWNEEVMVQFPHIMLAISSQRSKH
jgi:hypothetical protein